MITRHTFLIGLAAVMLAGTAVPADAARNTRPAVQLASGGCGAAVARVEAQTGGRVIKAQSVGNNRCRIVVLIPSNDRNRPPKPRTMVVPAN